MSYDAAAFLAGLFGSWTRANDRPQDLPDCERRPSDAPEPAPTGCPVCSSARTVSGSWSLWCRDCAEAGRETCLGAIPAADSDGAGTLPQDGDALDWQEYIGPDGRRCLVRSDAAGLELVDVQPCPVCGGLELWQDLAGEWHCSNCRPMPTTGQRLRQRAAELRGWDPLTWESELRPVAVTVPRVWPPAVPSRIIAAPIPTCSDCGRRAVIPGQPGRQAGLCFGCWSKRR